MKRILFCIAVFIMISCDSDGQKLITTRDGNAEISIPFNLKRTEVKPIWALANDDLQTKLQNMIDSEPKWKRLVQQKKMAVGLVLLNDTSDIKFARINGSNIMYAASLPKIAILLAAMDALEKGEIEETEKLRSDMRLMIARSDNEASTRIIDLLGFEKIEKVLTDPNYLLYDEEHGGGLWVGKRYAKTGRRYPEPLKGISHAATVTQVCRFYYLLINGQLVNFDRSAQMLAIMEDPEIHHKFVNSLEKVAPKAKLFRKSGSWQNYHADSILVWGPDRKYILVALTEDPDGEKILRNLALKTDNILKGLN
jgi:beta-lactamase class A